MYVCIYIYIYTYICVLSLSIHIYIYIYMIYLSIYLSLSLSIYIYICIYPPEAPGSDRRLRPFLYSVFRIFVLKIPESISNKNIPKSCFRPLRDHLLNPCWVNLVYYIVCHIGDSRLWLRAVIRGRFVRESPRGPRRRDVCPSANGCSRTIVRERLFGSPLGFRRPHFRVSTEVTFGRGDLSVCPLGGFTGAQECLVSDWRGVPQGSPEGQTLRAPPS